MGIKAAVWSARSKIQGSHHRQINHIPLFKGACTWIALKQKSILRSYLSTKHGCENTGKCVHDPVEKFVNDTQAKIPKTSVNTSHVLRDMIIAPELWRTRGAAQKEATGSLIES